MHRKPSWFVQFAHAVSLFTGRPISFILAASAILIWGVSGPLFGFSDTWQLVINTATTIITFLMVFVIQNTQNRDTASLHIKLDELILVTQKARNRLLDLEGLDDIELEKMQKDYGREARASIERHQIRSQGLLRKPARSRKRKK